MKFGFNPRTIDALGYLVVGASVVAAVLVSLNIRTDPPQQVPGTILGVTFVQTDGPASKRAAVRLDTGDIVNASVSPQLVIQPGDKVVLNRYRRLLTGSRTYAIAEGSR